MYELVKKENMKFERCFNSLQTVWLDSLNIVIMNELREIITFNSIRTFKG